MAKVVLYDGRDDSPTKGEINEFFMGERNPILLVIPPLVLHGMKGTGTEPAFLVNVPTEHYVYESPDEFRVAPHDPSIPYDWSRKDG
jgi:dTDP-4-dehydrorhamnose 3,5-epimerase